MSFFRLGRSRFVALAALAPTVAMCHTAVGGADLTPVNIIVIPSDTAGQVYYADALGMFKAAGLDVHVSTMTAVPPIISAVVSGAADIGFTTIGTAALGREKGLPVRLVAPGGLWNSVHPTAALVVAKDATEKSAGDFVGKTIGVPGIADLTYYGARAWLDRNGVDSSSVKFVEIPFPEMVPALKTHRVDGAIVAEPFLTIAKEDTRVVAAVNDAIADRFISTGWISSESWLNSHPAAAAAVARVLHQAAVWGNTHQQQSAAILLKYTKLSPTIAARMTRVDYATDMNAKLLAAPIDITARYSPAPSKLNPADLLWTP